MALLNDGKYGYSAHWQRAWLSLLRSPLYPDPVADEGEHHFTYSLFPHEGDWTEGNVVDEAFALNSPLVAHTGGEVEAWGLFTQTGVPLTLGALKRAEDDDSLILRLHESGGRRGVTELTFGMPLAAIDRVTILEESDEAAIPVEATDNGAWRLTVRPFEIVTLRLRKGPGTR